MAIYKKLRIRWLILGAICLAFSAAHILPIPSEFLSQPQTAYARGGGGAGAGGGGGAGAGGGGGDGAGVGAGVGAGIGAGIGAGGAIGGAAAGATGQGAATSAAATSTETTGLGKAGAVVGTTPAAESATTGLPTAIDQNQEDIN